MIFQLWIFCGCCLIKRSCVLIICCFASFLVCWWNFFYSKFSQFPVIIPWVGRHRESLKNSQNRSPLRVWLEDQEWNRVHMKPTDMVIGWNQTCSMQAIKIMLIWVVLSFLLRLCRWNVTQLTRFLVFNLGGLIASIQEKWSTISIQKLDGQCVWAKFFNGWWPGCQWVLRGSPLVVKK